MILLKKKLNGIKHKNNHINDGGRFDDIFDWCVATLMNPCLLHTYCHIACFFKCTTAQDNPLQMFIS